jgi:hypothetical protein
MPRMNVNPVALCLAESVGAWNTTAFRDVLKREIERLDPGLLPLQQALSATSYALGEGFQAMVLGVSEQAGSIRAEVGIFFSGIVAGCSCADDPTPVEPQNEYCELRFEIDIATGEATVSQVRD